MEILLVKTGRLATTADEEDRTRDELLERGFTNISTVSSQDLLLTGAFGKKLMFCLGFEVINPTDGRAVFHFGAGQMLRRLIETLARNPINDITVYLIGADFKKLPFTLSDKEVQHASIFEYGSFSPSVKVESSL